MKKKLEVVVQEGSNEHLIHQMHKMFGGEFKDQHYYVKNEQQKIEIKYFKIAGGIEVSLNSMIAYHGATFKVQSNKEEENRHLCFRFSFDGDYNDGILENAPSAGLKGGMCMYDTFLSYAGNLEQGVESKWLTIRVDKEAIENDFLQIKKHFGQVFNSQHPWLIYDTTPLEVHVILKELFSLEKNLPTPLFYAKILSKVGELLYIFFERILTRDVPKDINLHEDDLKNIMSIKKEITSSIGKTPSLDYFSQKYGFSISKLRRDFEHVFGTTIHKFHHNYRLERAKIVLGSKNISVTEVSRDLGYSSVAKFSHAFKEKFGVTPKDVAMKYYIK